MKVKNLNLLLTYKCPSQCRHCAYYAGLDGSGLMSAQDVKGYLRALRDHPLESLWIYGGEPFLYFGVLIEVVKIAKRRQIRQIGVLTNGYWSAKPGSGQKRLSLLKQVGLSDIIISTGGFHAERIPPELAIHGIQLALQVGFEAVTASVTFLSPRKASNPFNNCSEEIWAQLNEIPGVSLYENRVTMIGRATKDLLNYCQPGKTRRSRTCRPPSYIGGSFDQPEGLEIDPNGWVMICPGFSLGNVQTKSLTVLIGEYGNSDNFLWQTIRQQGPTGLLHRAKQEGYAPLKQYASECHLCYEVRKFLRPHYPGQLAPAECYTEPGCRKGNRR
jgi:hypothetical protein